jgi:EAL domain-containing protein (putative c-di-GMP-specific phosphodiesterase class I)
MMQTDDNLQIVKTIVTLAANLGMQVVAEGVETEEELNQLKLLRCQYAQGYLFSEPMEASEAGRFNANGAPVINSMTNLDVSELETMSFIM